MILPSTFAIWNRIIILKRFTCIQCPSDQFTIYQNQNCEKCVEGGICINGILFNQAGKFKI